jgi:alpha-glucuronidase
MRRTWESLEGDIDPRRFVEVAEFLQIQEREAQWWRDAALQYFRGFANLEIPTGHAEPAHPLEFYRSLDCPPDRNKPRCEPVYE